MNKISLMLGLPAYGNTTTVGFNQSLIDLTFTLKKYNIEVVFNWIGNESLIPRARNNIANAFLHSDCTHLLFVDSDLTFNAEDIIKMITYSVKEQKHLIGLPYAAKEIDWKRVIAAVQKGITAEELPHLVARIVANWDVNNLEFDGGQPAQVNHLGTGLMLISKTVVEQLASAHPEWRYQLMSNEKDHTGRTTAYDFFGIGPDENSGEYMSEDYSFCNAWSALGGKIWICPWAITHHMGSYHYECNIPAIAKHDLKLLNR